ncbi:Nitrilase/cyanide hydratase [Cystobacter fuscus DSM 2262]|uniref:Nitrilase/cyanide hydratase n=1 Tax=Cystobacter fuscus (strain ATCC 25194 / DSM 2262 / NBRC 100088 / M29) TaxID=1242864 RepID=S9QNJ8_CYSF2|nr:carbon-nitrogen hydrolase family protein [Cystobacter fuscus]EPX62879.1 Nitrilase/cyanide hydratase [Cystobacter fuscus DSM 2262]
MHLIAAAQMVSTSDKTHNLDSALRLVRRAADLGARLVGLPENFSWMGPEAERAAAAETLEGPTLSRMAEVARERKVTLLAGSILEQGAPGGRLYNTTVVFGPDGARLAVYRKIHLFDVDVGDGTPYRESAAVAPGTEVVVADTEVGRLGLSICYDLRFPELYRRLAAGGATLLAVPAAFTLMTGKDHWEVLLRARAIENQCYLFAPAQGGRHSPQRVTWGHAMVVDPWGLVTARASEGEGLAVAAMDTELLARVRRNLPCLQHRRLE